MATKKRAARSPTARVRSGPNAVFAGLALLAAFALSSLFATEAAHAVPSFARQTGQPCAACHTAFPELTPFGRRFKLAGYTLQGGDSKFPPVAAMVLPTFSHTASPYLPGPPPEQPPGLHANDNFVTQQVTGFYAGQVYGNLGAFIQVTGDPVGGTVALDSSDVRYVDSFKLFDKDAYWGVTVNNFPTVQDVWNTTPAFGWPQASSSVAPLFTPPQTRIEQGFGTGVMGAGSYVFWNDMLYAELTAYTGQSKTLQETLGLAPGANPDLLEGAAPYWRLAVEPHWGDHYLMIGTFGMYGRIIPAETFGFGYDDYTDIGFDSQYQYDGDKFSVTVKVSDIIEYQKLNSSFAQTNASNLNDRLNSFKANASFVWDHTYSLGAGYFKVSGTSDAGLYSSSSSSNSPNGDGLIADVAYLPFSHGSPGPYSSWNARLGVQYTHYLHLYGGTDNFDGSGAGAMHNASGNDTLMLYAWLMF
jgi:hypothetical protein